MLEVYTLDNRFYSPHLQPKICLRGPLPRAKVDPFKRSSDPIIPGLMHIEGPWLLPKETAESAVPDVVDAQARTSV